MNKSINNSIIINKLSDFITNKHIPNIVFHGSNGSGKHTILKNFIDKIYNYDTEEINKFVMYVNCAHGKGIKFIRDELKFFSKSNINTKSGIVFKSIILLNADKLTIDAQSALRRCIESFTHTTRFFILIDDKNKLLKPILSRFCEMYVHKHINNNEEINFHKQNNYLEDYSNKKKKHLKKIIKASKTATLEDINILVNKLYYQGYSALDLINYIEDSNINASKKAEYLVCFNKIKQEFRNEKLCMLFVLNFVFLRSNYNLENIVFM